MRLHTETHTLNSVCIPHAWNILRYSAQGCMAGVSMCIRLNLPQETLSDAMCHAARHGHTSIVTTLLSAGADVNHACDMAIIVAILFNHTDTAEVLIAAGASTYVSDMDYHMFIRGLQRRMGLQ